LGDANPRTQGVESFIHRSSHTRSLRNYAKKEFDHIRFIVVRKLQQPRHVSLVVAHCLFFILRQSDCLTRFRRPRAFRKTYGIIEVIPDRAVIVELARGGALSGEETRVLYRSSSMTSSNRVFRHDRRNSLSASAYACRVCLRQLFCIARTSRYLSMAHQEPVGKDGFCCGFGLGRAFSTLPVLISMPFPRTARWACDRDGLAIRTFLQEASPTYLCSVAQHERRTGS
jgi:hypothetical protein